VLIAELVAVVGIIAGMIEGFFLIMQGIAKVINKQAQLENRVGSCHLATLTKLEAQDEKILSLERQISAYRISMGNADFLDLPDEPSD